MFSILKFLWNLSSAITGFVLKMFMNFFLFILLLILLVFAAFFIGEKKGDVSGYGRGVSSMVHYKMEAESALAQLAEKDVALEAYVNRTARAEKSSATYYANWQGEKSRRISLGEENDRVIATNTRLVAEKKADQSQITSLTLLAAFREDTIRKGREAYSQLAMNHKNEINRRKAFQTDLAVIQARLTEVQTVADRVTFADGVLQKAADKERRSVFFLFAGVVVAVMNLLSIWAMARKKAGLPVLPDLRSAALALARQLPFL